VITLADGSVLDVAAFPLPDEIADEVMNRGQIARALNVSEPTITTWIGEGLPVLTKGGNGQAYEFQLSQCFAWRMHRKSGEERQRAAADESAAQMRMLFQNMDGDVAEDHAEWSPKQIREASLAELERMRASEARGDLVRSDRVLRLLEEMLTTIRQTVMTLPDYAEQEFGLSARQSDQMQGRCEDLLVELRNALARDGFETSDAAPVSLERARSGQLD
jgi:phage terminase Nu1 subunit (DNA packaging protein)